MVAPYVDAELVLNYRMESPVVVFVVRQVEAVVDHSIRRIGVTSVEIVAIMPETVASKEKVDVGEYICSDCQLLSIFFFEISFCYFELWESKSNDIDRTGDDSTHRVLSTLPRDNVDGFD